MNSKIGAVYVVAMVIAMLMGSSAGILCYNCTADDCGDPLVKTGLHSCQGTRCVTVRMPGGGSGPYVVRYCEQRYQTSSGKDGCHDRVDYEVRRTCICNTDYCNDAEGLNPTVKPLASSAASSIFNPTVKPLAASAALSIFNPTVKLLAALSVVFIFSMRLPMF